MGTKLLKHASALVLFLGGLLLAGCGGSSPASNPPATSTPVPSHMAYVVSMSGLSAYQASDGKQRWSFQPPSTPLFSAQEPLALANGVVYWIADQLYALNASDGTQRWSAPIGDSPGAVSTSGNLVYVLSSDLLYAFNTSDGTLRWRQQLQYSLGTTAKLLLDHETLYAINGANLTALRTDSGAIKWQFNLDPGLGESITNIFFAGNTLLVWSPTTLDGLNGSTGEKLWHKETQAKDLRVVGDTVYTIFMDVPTDGLSPIITGLRALHLPDGTQLWQVNAPVQDGQASFITGDTFFRAIGPTGGDVEARSIQDGHQLWHTQSSNTFVDLLADGGTLYLETQQGEIDALRGTDGKQLWQYQGASGDMSLFLMDHVLYLVGKDSGEVVALDPVTGTQLWHLAVGNSISALTVS
jgi:outer membrane protein assembly factor BamB